MPQLIVFLMLLILGFTIGRAPASGRTGTSSKIERSGFPQSSCSTPTSRRPASTRCMASW